MPRKIRELPRQNVYVDNRGRFTIPEYLRDAAGIKPDSWVEVVAEPNLDNCKGLLIMKE